MKSHKMILKSHKIISELWEARSRLYQSRFLQQNAYFSESAFFEIYSRPRRAKKKVQTLFFSRKKNIWRTRGTLKSQHRLGRPSETRRPGVRLWRPGGYLRFTFGPRWVYVRSTLGNLPSHPGPIFADFRWIADETQSSKAFLKWNGRFSKIKETAFFGVGANWSVLGASREEKERIPNVLAYNII